MLQKLDHCLPLNTNRRNLKLLNYVSGILLIHLLFQIEYSNVQAMRGSLFRTGRSVMYFDPFLDPYQFHRLLFKNNELNDHFIRIGRSKNKEQTQSPPPENPSENVDRFTETRLNIMRNAFRPSRFIILSPVFGSPSAWSRLRRTNLLNSKGSRRSLDRATVIEGDQTRGSDAIANDGDSSVESLSENESLKEHRNEGGSKFGAYNPRSQRGTFGRSNFAAATSSDLVQPNLSSAAGRQYQSIDADEMLRFGRRR